MISDLFNYSKSFLNPALKLLVPLLFLVGTYYAYRAMTRYSGEISRLMRALIVVGIVGFLANSFRYLADISVVTWKWGESVALLAFCLANLYAAWYAAGPLMKFIQQLIYEDLSARGIR